LLATLQFYGLDFDTTKQVNATYCSTDGKNRCYTVRGCTVDSSTKMTCRTVAGEQSCHIAIR